MHYAQAKTLLTSWNSVNIYRGCAHGCVYCDSRSNCYQFSHPFEDIEVKENAPELLEKLLRSKKQKIVIGTGSMADPYQPCEKELRLMRRCLELIDRYEFGATVITKSDLVLRDLDLFENIHRKAKAAIQVSLTIADDNLSAILEPNVCNTTRRYEVLKTLQKHNIPTVVWMTPILPFLTDTEENIRTILDYCIDADVKGIICFDIGMTLRDGDREYYYRALDRHFPGLSETYQKKYRNAYKVSSDNRESLLEMFHETCEAHGILHTPDECFAYLMEMPEHYPQLSLFN